MPTLPPRKAGKRGETDPSPYVTIIAWIVLTLALGLVALISAPFGTFLGGSQYAVVSAIHGMLATLGLIVAAVVLYLGWRLFLGKIRALTDLRIFAILSTLISATTIIFGNWIYIAYRTPGGVREFFLENNPTIHEIFFEFKEFIALFSLPLFFASTFIIWRYGPDLTKDRPLRTWTFFVLVLAWGAFILAFLLGAAITKLRSV